MEVFVVMVDMYVSCTCVDLPHQRTVAERYVNSLRGWV